MLRMNLRLCMPFMVVALMCFPASTSFQLSSIGSFMYNTLCSFVECCNHSWEEFNSSELKKVLKKHVFGQDIAIQTAVNALKSHCEGHGNKALTMSFHGRTGVGKNYITSFIRDSLYKRGEKSTYAHFFYGKASFPSEKRVEEYKNDLRNWVIGNVSKCEYSLFVFDEVEKMPAGILDGLKPFLDHYGQIYGVDYRKAIFIFLSNLGGEEIAKTYLQMWNAGKKREEMELSDFENILRMNAFNKPGGLRHSNTIESSLIDHYVPFLPLEESHVRQCIRFHFQKRGLHEPSKELLNQVLKEITFGPDETPIFSNGGCKRITQKVNAHFERRQWDEL